MLASIYLAPRRLRNALRTVLDCRPAVFSSSSLCDPTDRFLARHLGPSSEESKEMLEFLGFKSMDEFMRKVVPKEIRLKKKLKLPAAMTESESLRWLKKLTSKNIVTKSFLGMGYNETITPGVILRNMLENPGWYTAYTPYQAEVSQGRLEMLLNFQTMVCDLTGMAICNASLLDEGTAAGEAMNMCQTINGDGKKRFLSLDTVWAHTQDVVRTRCNALGVIFDVCCLDDLSRALTKGNVSGVLIQSPNSNGEVVDLSALSKLIASKGSLIVVATDLLALTLIKPPGEYGVDIVVGSAQRFGVPMNYGGPHAGYLATTTKHARKMPGRLIGVTRDSNGKPALRMAMQTREQHIRRDKATSNICTAQALLANMAASYAIYHGPVGLKEIAGRIHRLTWLLQEGLEYRQFVVANMNGGFFDSILIKVPSAELAVTLALKKEKMSIRQVGADMIGVSIGETIVVQDVLDLINCLVVCRDGAASAQKMTMADLNEINGTWRETAINSSLLRSSPILTHPVFNSYHSETKMLRYLKRLENKDIALNTSMISLGSCTMKLNATSEMIPVTWPEVCNMHPFADKTTTKGYDDLVDTLHSHLLAITGFAAASSQPNSGAQGEYAGLLTIKRYLESIGQRERDICLIPVSAHGTNPASASMAGMRVIVVKSDEDGRIDMTDLNEKINEHKDKLAVLMATYPSTFGVFERGIVKAIQSIHDAGGQVYMDGANMNAQVGHTSPATMGADVCHLNLHKTFCIPHGGGGPGVGTICVASHLANFLPGHVMNNTSHAVSSAPHGSAAILPIPLMYISMLGASGLRSVTSHAILNANYMAKRLETHYPILYRVNNMCAHEFIIDLRHFKLIGVSEEDVAKRLQDFGFHSPTMSWPVPGTLMVEPTESEDKGEMDRFIEAMICIRQEISAVADGRIKAEDSPLHHAPHTMEVVISDEWSRAYSRNVAAFPLEWVRGRKFWPSVGRVDNVFGDRNLVCSCPPVSDYEAEPVLEAVPIQVAAKSSQKKKNT